MGGKTPNCQPPGVHLTTGEEAEAGKDSQHVGKGQQPLQHTLGVQQQCRAQPKRGEIGKVIQLGTCGGSKGQVPGGHQVQGTPCRSPLGWGRRTHPMLSRRQAAGPRPRQPDPAGSPGAAASRSTGIAWVGEPHYSAPVAHCFTPFLSCLPQLLRMEVSPATRLATEEAELG